MEVWKDIGGFEGRYMVSSFGRVKSMERKARKWDGDKTIHETILAQGSSGKAWGGYPRVALSKDGVKYYRAVHRLVAEAFLPNPSGFKEVNHKDETRNNNNVDNLEWCDRTYNFHYGTAVKRLGINSGISRTGRPRKKRENSKKCIPVMCIETGEVFAGAICAADKYSVRGSNINNCCRGRAHTCGGLHWQYANSTQKSS